MVDNQVSHIVTHVTLELLRKNIIIRYCIVSNSHKKKEFCMMPSQGSTSQSIQVLPQLCYYP